jgi:hypothetical protein
MGTGIGELVDGIPIRTSFTSVRRSHVRELARARRGSSRGQSNRFGAKLGTPRRPRPFGPIDRLHTGRLRGDSGIPGLAVAGTQRRTTPNRRQFIVYLYSHVKRNLQKI